MAGQRRSLAVFLVALAIAGCASADSIDLQGHRGARGLAPENTLAGFRRAVTLGVSTLELDTGVTRDGVVVIHHDSALNPALARGADGRWIESAIALNSLTFRQLRRYDVGRLRPGSAYAARYPQQAAEDGETIPTLDTLFAWLRADGQQRIRVNIETKLSPLAPAASASPEVMIKAILKSIARHRMVERVTLQSFDWRTLALARVAAPAIPRVHLTARQSWLDNLDPRWNAGLNLEDHGSVPGLVRAAGGDAWSPFHGDLGEGDRATARALGLKVIPWTVNAPADIERMLDLGVDGLITDYPDLARRLITARGLAVAPIDWKRSSQTGSR